MLQYALPVFKSWVDYTTRSRTPDFSTTKMGQYLNYRQKQGLSPRAEGNIMGKVKTQVEPTHQKAVNQYAQQLQKHNMDTSIASKKGYADLESRKFNTYAKTGETIGLKDEQIKEDAKQKFALGEHKTEEQQRLEDDTARTKLYGDLMSVGTNYLTNTFPDAFGGDAPWMKQGGLDEILNMDQESAQNFFDSLSEDQQKQFIQWFLRQTKGKSNEEQKYQEEEPLYETDQGEIS